MAYINQTAKAAIAAHLKPVLKEYGMKGTLSINHHTSITLTLREGSIDFAKELGEYYARSPKAQECGWTVPEKMAEQDINLYSYREVYSKATSEFLAKAEDALKVAGWYNNSDSMTDYFDTAYYVYIKVGAWGKPYVLTTVNQKAAA